ncbi:uncharacterized protein LOC107266791 isoform X2 [Cephus cinctus]|uniref:Uncharacterized protein LOC107266791 isoform X2 n=1 Tax=Cephus cinctus TaxID=211228 RepID=A0AAJ7RFP0_CEPCN|nr:uncharacterized protein LOC107266791 isoform X2 [Cephus cinctus]
MQIKQILTVLAILSAAIAVVTAYGPSQQSGPLKRDLYFGPRYNAYHSYPRRHRGFYEIPQHRPEEQRQPLSFGGHSSYLKIGDQRLDFASIPAALSFENSRLLATADPITIPAISSVAEAPANHATAIPAVSTMSDIPLSDTPAPKSAASTSAVTAGRSGSIKANELYNPASTASRPMVPTMSPTSATPRLTLALGDGSTRLTSSSIPRAVSESSTVPFNEKIITSTATPVSLKPPEPNYAVLGEKIVLHQGKYVPQNQNQNQNQNQFVLVETKYHPGRTKYSLQNQNQNEFTSIGTKYHSESNDRFIFPGMNKNHAQGTILLPETTYVQPYQNENQNQNYNQNQFAFTQIKYPETSSRFTFPETNKDQIQPLKVNYLVPQDLKTPLIQQVPQSFNYLSSLPISIQTKFPQADFPVLAASAISDSVQTINYSTPRLPKIEFTTGDSASVSLPSAGRIPNFRFDGSFADVGQSGQTRNSPFSSGLQLNLGGFAGIDYSNYQRSLSNPSSISGTRPMVLGVAKVGLALTEPRRSPAPAFNTPTNPKNKGMEAVWTRTNDRFSTPKWILGSTHAHMKMVAIMADHDLIPRRMCGTNAAPRFFNYVQNIQSVYN